jgi:hypothetical protein
MGLVLAKQLGAASPIEACRIAHEQHCSSNQVSQHGEVLTAK